MRILWLAPIHYDKVRNIHPAPWISTLAEFLVKDKGASLCMLNYQSDLEQEVIREESDGVEYVFLRSPRPKVDHLGMFRKRISILDKWIADNEHRFDLIHVHGSEHQYEVSASRSKLPHILSMQGIMNECLKVLPQRLTYTHLNWWLSSIYEKKYLKHIRNFICRTHFDTGFINSVQPDARIFENWEMIRPEFFQDLGDRKSKRILFMGGTHPIKGLKTVLQALDILTMKHNIKLCILGGIDPDVISDIILGNDLTTISRDQIEMVGFQDVKGVIKAFGQSSLMVHASLIDNSPNSICEAQVAGLPVVAVDVGGISSLINHKETGMLCTRNPFDMASAIEELLANKNLYRRVVERSRMIARKRHNRDRIGQNTIHIYQEILQN